MSTTKQQQLMARVEILDVLSRYVRGCDRGDAASLKSCYFEDAIEEHAGNYTGNAHEYVEGAIPRILNMDAMQHLLGSSHIDFAENCKLAWVETNVWTFLRLNVDGTPTDTLTGGRLLDKFECRDGDWKIVHRKTILDWNRDVPSSEGWCNGLINFDNPGALLGCKGDEDASFERF